MINSGKLVGKTVFITGASRGIGKSIALKVAKDGANVVIAAKTVTAHPKLPGTIYSAAEEVEKAGGKAIPCVVDIRDEAQVKKAVEDAVAKFGGIDILINNASAISLTPTEDTDMKRYDLMHNINTRGTFLVTKTCLPYLKKSSHAHVLNLSPPLNMVPHWFSPHVAYTIAKYGMSMCILGMAQEYQSQNIAFNALWPKTGIHTAAIEMLTGKESAKYCRKPEIISDAAYAIITQDPKKVTGNFFIDEDVLRNAGITDLKQYAVDPEYHDKLMPDFFVDDKPIDGPFGTVPGAAEASKPAESAAPTGKVAGLFQKIEASLSPEVVQRTQAVFEFHVTGEEEGKWFVDLKTGNGQCGQGEAPSKPDAILTMETNNFFNMFSGKLKPANAYMMGKLKIKGNLQKALKLEKLMSSLKAKL